MLEKVIFKISRNLTAGSEELLFNFLKEIKKLNVKIEKEEILTALQRIIEAKPQMAVFYKAMEIFAKENDDVKNIIDKLILKIEGAIPKISENLLKILPKDLKILTHSNSSTVIRTLKNIKDKVNIKKIICTDSYPGEEGKKTEKDLKKYDFEVERIPDTHVIRALEEVNGVFIGADAIYEDGFYNKVGTRIILTLSQEFGVKSYLLSSTLKISDNLKHLKLDDYYFESIPLELVDCIVTEEGIKCK